MGILDSVKSRLVRALLPAGVVDAAEALLPGLINGEFSGMHMQSMNQLSALFERQRGFKSLTKAGAKSHFDRWQYTGATAIAEAFALADWQVETPTEEGWEAAPQHSLAKVLAEPNPWIPSRMLMYFMGLDLCFMGEHYWRVVFNSLEEPAQLWPVMGDVTPIPDKETFIKGYTQKLATDKGVIENTYEPDEIVQIHLPMLQDLYKSMSPVRAAGGSIQVDEQIIKSQWYAFRNGIFAAGILLMSETDPDKRKELLDQFNSLYAEARGSGKAIGLSKTMDWKETTRKPREMDWGGSSLKARDEILGALRVPPIIAGVTRDVQNRATADAAEYVFGRWTIAPKLALVEDQLNLDLCKRYYPDPVRIHFPSAVPEDSTQKRDDTDMLLRTYSITINEARERYGFPPVDWGDEPLVPIGVAPISYIGAPTEPGNGKQQALAHMPADIRAKVELAGRRGFNVQARRVIITRSVDVENKFAKPYRRAWVKIFDELERLFLERFDAQPEAQAVVQQAATDVVDEVLDPTQVSAWLSDKTKPYTVRGLVIGGEFDGEIADVAGRKSWGARSDALISATQKYDATYWHEVAETTREQMLETIAESLAKRATWDEMRAAVVTKFGQMKESRAANIVTTETTRLMNAGGQAFREEFKLDYKQWIAQMVNTRETHAAVDGTVIPNNENFLVGGLETPYPGATGDPAEDCNCHCRAIAVPKKE